MPLSRLEIEQTAKDRWVGSVEISGISNYVERIIAGSYGEALAMAQVLYYKHKPEEMPSTHRVAADGAVMTKMIYDRADDVILKAVGIDRAVKNSPPPLDDVGGCAEEIADEKDPHFDWMMGVPPNAVPTDHDHYTVSAHVETVMVPHEPAEVATVPTACALCGAVDIDWQAHILSPSHIAVMAAHQMPKRKKVLSEEHKRKMTEGRERARLARQIVRGAEGPEAA